VYNVIHLFGSFNIGGAEILAYDVCKHFPQEYGHTIVVTYRGGELERRFEKEGLSIHYIPLDSSRFGFIKQLRKLIIDHQINIIHIHKGLDVLYVKAAAMGLDVKIVQTVHSIGNGRLYWFLRKGAKMFSDHITFVSKDVRDHYENKEMLPSNQSILYNGIEPRKMETTDTILGELNLNESSIIAGMIGNFKNDVRDQFTICKALKSILKKHPDFHFLFVGGKSKIKPHFFDECYNFCERNDMLENVHFLGTRPDVPEILASIDLFVYSSNRDTFGIAVVEAMMSGTPVIVNDLPVFQEITENGTYAQLYKTKDADDLAEKIDYFINHPEKRSELGERGRTWALENYTIEKHIEQLHSIYTELLSD